MSWDAFARFQPLQVMLWSILHCAQIASRTCSAAACLLPFLALLPQSPTSLRGSHTFSVTYTNKTEFLMHQFVFKICLAHLTIYLVIIVNVMHWCSFKISNTQNPFIFPFEKGKKSVETSFLNSVFGKYSWKNIYLDHFYPTNFISWIHTNQLTGYSSVNL